MFGGKLIGQGTYGCAVAPPLLCKGRARAEQNESKVGKITIEGDAETELQISKILRESKLWKHYFVLPELNSCEPIQKQRSEDWNECRITREVPQNELLQIVSSYGGKSFSSLGSINLHPSRFNYVYFFQHLLEACALMALKGVVHFDLHRANILVDRHGVPRLLDFGMAFSANELSYEIIDNRWKVYDPKYDSEPPEITVATGIRKGIPLDTVVQATIFEKPVFRNYEIIFRESRETLVASLESFCMKSKSFRRKDWLTVFNTYWPGFDSFALAAVLLNVLRTQLTWPEFVNSSAWQEKGDIILDILKRMLNPNPSLRYDCVEALSLFDPQNAVLRNSEAWLQARRRE
jgi:serine/threonine protein kinase